MYKKTIWYCILQQQWGDDIHYSQVDDRSTNHFLQNSVKWVSIALCIWTMAEKKNFWRVEWACADILLNIREFLVKVVLQFICLIINLITYAWILFPSDRNKLFYIEGEILLVSLKKVDKFDDEIWKSLALLLSFCSNFFTYS